MKNGDNNIFLQENKFFPRVFTANSIIAPFILVTTAKSTDDNLRVS